MLKGSYLLSIGLLICLASCNVLGEHNPDAYNQVHPDSVFTISPVIGSIQADGISTIRISALLAPDNPDLDTVTFSTTSGTLTGADENGILTVQANDAGLATAVLQSPTSQGEAVVRASIGGVNRESIITFTPIDLDQVFRFEPRFNGMSIDSESTSIFADKASTIELWASVESNNLLNTITFTSSSGQFVGGGRTVDLVTDPSGVLSALLQVDSKPGPIFLEAKMGNFLRRDTVQLIRAVPDSIVVDAGAFTLEADSSFSKTTTAKGVLMRGEMGIASTATQVTFSALDASGNLVDGFTSPTDGFRNTTSSNENGVVTAEFSVGGTSYRGLVTIFINSRLPDGTVVTGSDTIRIIDSE